METIRGKVSNIRRDVQVIEASYSDRGSSSGSTTDITNFELGGRSMRYKSGRATYNAMNEGDELIVAGKSKGTVFQVIAFRNVTKSLNSYKNKSIPLFTVVAIGTLVFGSGLPHFSFSPVSHWWHRYRQLLCSSGFVPFSYTGITGSGMRLSRLRI
jgi:hypothetical protein